MGRKTHPTANRLGYNKDWFASWYADKKQFPVFLAQDIVLRTELDRYLKKVGKFSVVSHISIGRDSRNIIISIPTSRMNQLIGKGGEVVQDIEKKMQVVLDKVGNPEKRKIKINVVEAPVRETDALLVAKSIASQIELRKPVKRVMERTATDAIRMGALGIKIKAKGRINGAEMTRAYQHGEGVMRLQSFRSNANYAQAYAYTKYGVIGVKVWVLLPSVQRKPVVKSKGVNK